MDLQAFLDPEGGGKAQNAAPTTCYCCVLSESAVLYPLLFVAVKAPQIQGNAGLIYDHNCRDQEERDEIRFARYLAESAACSDCAFSVQRAPDHGAVFDR